MSLGQANVNPLEVSSGDDCISIVSGSENVRATGITCGPGHGISIGSLGANNSEAYVSNVVVNKATLIGTTNGVRIKTWQGGHGVAKNIIFQDIIMKNVTNPIIINQDYCDRVESCPQQKSAVQVSNVLYKNIQGTSSRPVAVKFECSKSIPCQGISMQNVKLVDQTQQDVVSTASCSNVKLDTKGHVGNAVTDDYHDYIGTFEYWWNHGLISDSTYHQLKTACYSVSSQHPSLQCMEALRSAELEQGNIDPYSIFTKPCNNTVQLKSFLKGRYPWMSRAYDPCTERYSNVYFNRVEVQKALHVNVTRLSYPWKSCSDIVGNYWTDSPVSMLPIYRELITAGLKIWVFSGDTDAVVPITATRYSIDALKLATITNWYPWYDHGKVGGWSQVYKGLTLVTVTGAGHEVPLHRPRQAFIIFRSFLENKPMPMS
ncbi:hypothetical protein F2Q69_00032186 [Brassica cretica]|uniref:Uncharacterized protein n=1 Tax=Brassica cretica TaxID=69181 RepID=A0A8S9RR75_BRACR|nr:hypothetical protein F2Q69_00032186 [Brassica cretica]